MASPLVWLSDGATGASPESVKAELVKLAHLRDLGAERLDLSAIPPERLRQLAIIARRSTPRALRHMAPERCYPILLAALAASHTEIVDELVRLFDQALAEAIDLPTSGSAGASFYRGEPGTTRFVVDSDRELLVGATFVGAQVAELLHAATIAIVAEVPLATLAHAV